MFSIVVLCSYISITLVCLSKKIFIAVLFAYYFRTINLVDSILSKQSSFFSGIYIEILEWC